MRPEAFFLPVKNHFQKYFLWLDLVQVNLGFSMRKFVLFIFASSIFSGFAPAQKQKVSLITEPALGGFGGVLFSLFVDPNTPYRDSVDGKVVLSRAKPNLYGAGGAYTANGTWVLAAGGRYLLARKLGMRMGIDVARGPEEWAYFFWHKLGEIKKAGFC